VGPKYPIRGSELINWDPHAALDYADRRIRVNAVAPGPILTERLEHAGAEAQRQAGLAMPMRRIGRPEEVASAVVWLCSDQASFITGATLPIDGGKLAGAARFGPILSKDRVALDADSD
jgi:NAD(P)-dependent dehydrogenase (short-subunit alcohol dehydrogenase family)